MFRRFKYKISYVTKRKEINDLTKVFINGGDISLGEKEESESIPDRIQGRHQPLTNKFLGEEDANEFAELTGLILDERKIDSLGIGRSKSRNTMNMPMLEIHNLKLASRSGPKGDTVNQIIVTLTQKRGVVATRDKWGNVEIAGFFKPETPQEGWFERIPVAGRAGEYTYTPRLYERPKTGSTEEGSEQVLPEGWFVFRGGSTLIFDLDYSSDKEEVKLQYVIKKDINDEERMKRQYDMLFNRQDYSLNATYFGTPFGNLEAKTFAIIHKNL